VAGALQRSRGRKRQRARASSRSRSSSSNGSSRSNGSRRCSHGSSSRQSHGSRSRSRLAVRRPVPWLLSASSLRLAQGQRPQLPARPRQQLPSSRPQSRQQLPCPRGRGARRQPQRLRLLGQSWLLGHAGKLRQPPGKLQHPPPLLAPPTLRPRQRRLAAGVAAEGRLLSPLQRRLGAAVAAGGRRRRLQRRRLDSGRGSCGVGMMQRCRRSGRRGARPWLQQPRAGNGQRRSWWAGGRRRLLPSAGGDLAFHARHAAARLQCPGREAGLVMSLAGI